MKTLFHVTLTGIIMVGILKALLGLDISNNLLGALVTNLYLLQLLDSKKVARGVE